MKLALTLILISIGISLFAQIAINNDNSPPDNSAILDIKSGNKGVLIPRMTVEERNAIENPADGLMIYCTNCGIKGSLSIFASGSWNTYSPCPDVSAPAESYPEITPDYVTWTWEDSYGGSLGFKWNTVPDYNSAIDVGLSNQYQEYGLECSGSYTRYVWAYNICGVSPMTALNASLVLPGTPVAWYQSPCVNSIIWNWFNLGGTLGLRFSSQNDYETAIDLGYVESYTENNLDCGTNYTRYVWAYSACGHSAPLILQGYTGACNPGSPCTGLPTVTYNGQVYNTLQIGSQCWLKENLNTGTMIPDNQDPANNGIIEKYCYNNDPANCTLYGGLYQWNEAMMYSVFETAQGICPPGWHIPSETEYIGLANYLGGEDIAGGKLKESCTTHWNSPNLEASNESGFTAMGVGARGYDGYFYSLGYSTAFWSSTQFDADLAGQRTLEYNNDNFTLYNVPKSVGYSIRCIKN